MTFDITRYDNGILYSKELLSVTLRHDPQQGHWNVTSEGHWNIEEEATRQVLEHDKALLLQITEPMLDQRSQNDLTPEYIMWLRQDLRLLYATDTMKPQYPVGRLWNADVRRMFLAHLTCMSKRPWAGAATGHSSSVKPIGDSRESRCTAVNWIEELRARRGTEAEQ